jgi:hypothetical protein
MSGSNSSVPADRGPESLAPLSFTVHTPPRTEAARGRWKMLAILLACAAPVIASYFTYFVIRPDARTNYSTLIEPARALPAALPLAELDGRRVSPASLHGQWLLVVAAPGACDAACERLLYLQRQLREMTGRERDRIDKLWLVTDDAPIRPELAAALAAAPATRVLRVPHAALAQWLAPAPGESLASHLYIVDPMGQWMMRAPVQPEPRKLKRDVERLLRASSSWDRAGR